MGLSDDPKGQLLSQLAELVKEISGLPECRNSCKKMHGTLVRRIKLLSPLFEELRDGNEESMVKIEEIRGFELLKSALDSTKKLLQSINEGSKLYQVILSLNFFFLC